MPKFIDTSVGIPTDYVPVTPSDSTDNVGDGVVLGFYIETGGAVVFTTNSGNDRTVTFADGAFVPCAGITRIKSTGTTATGIFVVSI